MLRAPYFVQILVELIRVFESIAVMSFKQTYIQELSQINTGNHDNLRLVDNKSFVMKKLGLPSSIRIMSGAVIEFLPQINVNYATLVRAHTGGLIAALSQATPGRRNQIQRNMFGQNQRKHAHDPF